MRNLVATGVIALVVLISLAATALAGAQETRDGIKSLTVIAGPPPPAMTFRVMQGGERIDLDGQIYQWDPGSGRYRAVQGVAYGWIELNPLGGGNGGFQYQPPGGGTPTAGSYAHVGP